MDISLDLITAVREGQLERARKLITTFGLSYSPQWEEGYVLLCESIKNQKNDITKLLIRNGSRINSPNQASSDTPLHCAVRYGDIEIIEMLLNQGAHIDAVSKDSFTSLFIATENGNEEVIKILLDRGANVNARQGNGLTVLHTASERGNKDLVKLFLKHGAEVNASDKEDKTPLHFVAAANFISLGTLDTIKILLRFGADIDSRDKYGRAALHLAAEISSVSVVEILLKFSAEIDPRDDCGRTPLHLAVEEKHVKVVEVLLEYGSDINMIHNHHLIMSSMRSLSDTVYDDEEPPGNELKYRLYTVIKNHIFKLKVANFYVSKENLLSINCDGNVQFCQRELAATKICNGTVSLYNILTKNENQLAVYARNEHIAQELKSEYFPMFKEYGGLIKARFRKGMCRNWLLERGTNLLKSLFKKFSHLPVLPCDCIGQILTHLDNKYLIILTDSSIRDDSQSLEDFLPLHLAIKERQKEVATQLIGHGAEVNAKDKSGKSPIYYAVENGDVEITKLLLANKADVGDPGLLNTAVKKGCREIVGILLQHEVDVEATDHSGRTALHFSTYNHQSLYEREIIQLLLSKGANVNAKTKYGETALHHASSTGNETVVAELLESNADVNCISDTGVTPLHLSIEYQYEEIVRLLLHKGVDVNAQQEDSTTALHMAINVGNEKIVKLLLEHGADVNFKYRRHKTPLHFATDIGDEVNVKMLLEFGANVNSTDLSRRTALHVAAKIGNTNIVKSLLEFGAEVEPRDDYYRTPLQKASNCHVVKALLEYGAEVDSMVFECIIYGMDEEGEDYHMDRFYSSSLRQTLAILKRHIIKMKVANLYVSDRSILARFDEDEISDFQNECEEELELLKSEVCSGTVSFYDILTSSRNQSAVYARNKNIVRCFKSGGYKRKFPLYAVLIIGQFRRGMRKRRLLDRANVSLNSLLNCCHLPVLPVGCIEKILGFFNDEQLKILTKFSISECSGDGGPICKKPKLDHNIMLEKCNSFSI